jgi:spore coat polysaccharide biosynthesis protein SpsF
VKIVAIIQARFGSERLPGKVLKDIAGEPMLARVVNRTQRASALDDIVIATTESVLDDVISELCESKSWKCFRGSELDVLERYYQAAVATQADIIVRITSDCPFIEPEVADLVIRECLNRQPSLDYASNTLPPRTFPRGLDTEVFRFDVLERAWREDQDPAWREHVTPYIYRNPESFSLYGVSNDVDYSTMRWTVDTPEDMAFVRCVYDYFGHDHFSWREVIAALEEHPEWGDFNQDVLHKTAP